MHKFFVEKEQIDGEYIYIKGQDTKHIENALRLNIGDKIKISCNEKNYISQITELGNPLETKILSCEDGNSEPDVDIILYQGLAKGNKMDFILQKCTEIGVKDFYAVEMGRSVVRIKNDKWKKNRLERYNTITEEAAKQCKRDYIPRVKGMIDFNEMLELLKDEKDILIPYESDGDNNIENIIKELDGERINIVIGPEGGFDHNEIEMLKDLGGKTSSLGPRILRTETAGIVTSTILLYELGDLGVINQ